MNSKYWEEDIETMPREALRALQVQRLQKTIRIASHSPYYGKVFKECGITAEDILIIGEIRDQGTARLAVDAALSGHLIFADQRLKYVER